MLPTDHHPRHAQLFELLRQQNLSAEAACRLQDRPLHPGRGPAMEWQYLAAQSLTRPMPARD